MDDLVRRQDLLDILANSSDSWAAGVPGNSTWWAHSVRIKDNILREIKKLEPVPVADKKKLTELLVQDGRRVNAGALAGHILDNCALFATNHLPLEMKARSDCSTLEYCKGWNDAVKQMSASHMQAMPCMVGDKFWTDIGEEEAYLEEMEVSSISFKKDGCLIGLSCGTLYKEITPEDIGKTAFFSEKEALAALENELGIVDELLAKATAICEDLNKDNAYQREYARRMSGSWLDWEEFDRESGLLDELSY